MVLLWSGEENLADERYRRYTIDAVCPVLCQWCCTRELGTLMFRLVLVLVGIPGNLSPGEPHIILSVPRPRRVCINAFSRYKNGAFSKSRLTRQSLN